MKFQPEESLPWAKDYFKEYTGDPVFLPVLLGRFTDSGGIYLETDRCKIYLFPGKRITEAIRLWIHQNTDKTVAAIGLSQTSSYPFYELSDDGGVMTLVHYNVMGNITLTPHPPEDARARKSK